MKYKGVLLATAGGVAAAGGAQAADLPLKAAPMMSAPPVTWAGAYVGVHVGAAWQTATGRFSEYTDPAAQYSTTEAGFIGGGQIGYNWQNGNIVYGVEADISGLTGKPTVCCFSDASDKSYTGQINWLSTFRGRVGIASSNVLGYVTGGLAVGGVKNHAYVYSPVALKSESRTRVGWTVGAGVEYMMSRNWTVGLEGLYVDLGSKTVQDVGGNNKTTKFSNTATIARVKLNYKW